MKMSPEDIKRRTQAAMILLSESSTTLEKIHSVMGMLKGINKKLDTALLLVEKQALSLDLVTQGAYIELAVEHLPEETEEQKKRKKGLLLFIKTWGELKSEVGRVQAEVDLGHNVQDSQFWTNMLAFAKGPAALITVVAVGVVMLAQSSVDIVIANEGCSTITATGVPISLPGFKLPSKSIDSGGAETATIPALTLTVDGTKGQSLVLSSLVFHFTMNLSNSVTDVTFDGESLLHKVSTLDLGTKASHTLKLMCS